ncbi:MAG: DUF4270 family protein, partial [Balneolaceae bacterium]
MVVLSGCKEDPGQVGSRFIDPDANVSTKTIDLDDAEVISDPTYSGNIRNMAIGSYNDPLFGMIETVGYLRPSISRQVIDSINTETDTMEIRFIFSNQVYGDTTATANFSIYEISDIWRGNELKYSDQLNFDTSK